MRVMYVDQPAGRLPIYAFVLKEKLEKLLAVPKVKREAAVKLKSIESKKLASGVGAGQTASQQFKVPPCYSLLGHKCDEPASLIQKYNSSLDCFQFL